MILRPNDFVGWRINWSDKAANIAELASELLDELRQAIGDALDAEHVTPLI